MFVRIKKHAGSKNSSVLICHSIRQNGRIQQKIISRVGTASQPEDLLELQATAYEQIKDIKAAKQKAYEEPIQISNTISLDTREISRQNTGIPDILGQLYDKLGFSRILTGKAGKILKSVVLSRFIEPSSKRKASSTIERHFGESILEDSIYRMMDALKENLSRSREIVFRATQKATDSKIDLVLFDVTTLHFETIEKDELRNFGYSKNFRFNTTQVTLALATTSNGLPVGYRLFPGNTAEVSTLMECIKLWRKELSIGKVIVIADRGMMSKENVEQLEHEKMQYIIAYPMKKSTAELKEEILSYTDYKANVIQNELFWTREIEIKPGQRLIVTYNEKRRDRDRKQRERLIEKIKKKLGPTKKAKNLVSNLGYLKYTKIGEQFVAELNEAKIADDALWDGLHAVLTNTELAAKDAIDRYKKLWLIEDAFRLNKHNLKMRPIYHCTPERIKTHIEICFLTFALVRHAQERLKKAGYPMSIEDFREELISIEASIICDQSNGQLYRMPSHMTEQGRKIYKIFGREKHLQIQRLENI